MTPNERTKWVRQFTKALRTGQLLKDSPPDDSLGEVLIAFSVFPCKYPSFGTYWICDDGIVFAGLNGDIVLPYDNILSVEVQSGTTLPEVLLWGMRYWMIDYISFSMKASGSVQLPFVLLDDGLRRSSLFWVLLEKMRKSSGACTGATHETACTE